MSSEGGGEPQSFTQAAPNELKLGKEGQRGESWPSAWRWGPGGEPGTGEEDQRSGGPVADLQPNFKTIQAWSKI